MNLLELDYGKRQAAIRKIKMIKIEKMRAELPVLSREEIIRYHLPRHEALLRAIEQDGYKNTAHYIRQLIDYQDHLRSLYGPDSHVWRRPILIHHMEILHDLRDGLIQAEKEHFWDNTAHELKEILKLAVRYAFGGDDWWWLGQQLLNQAILISKEFEKDGGMYHSIARYALGKFYLEKITDVDVALKHLNIARSLSLGNPWSAKGIFEGHQATVFAEVSVLLFHIYLKQARHCMKSNVTKAFRLTEMARKAARDGCHYSGETEALIFRGELEQMLHDTQSAITSFKRALVIQSSHENPHWKCVAYCHLGIAYLKHGMFSSALETLRGLKTYALKHKLIYYVAQSYKYLGEYYLKEGTPQSATPLLKMALRYFVAGNHVKEADSTRNYAAMSMVIQITNGHWRFHRLLARISTGIEFLDQYIKLVVACNRKNPDFDVSMLKLIDWKDSRATFSEDLKRGFGRIDAEMSDEDIVSLQAAESSQEINIEERVLSVSSLTGRESFDVNESIKSFGSRESEDDYNDDNGGEGSDMTLD